MAKGNTGGKYAKSVSTEKKLTAKDFSVGERVGIAPEWRDPGEDDNTTYWVVGINGDRVVIRDEMFGMALNPSQSVSPDMLQKKNDANALRVSPTTTPFTDVDLYTMARSGRTRAISVQNISRTLRNANGTFTMTDNDGPVTFTRQSATKWRVRSSYATETMDDIGAAQTVYDLTRGSKRNRSAYP